MFQWPPLRTDRASVFLECATNGNGEVFEVDVLREEHRLLMLLEFDAGSNAIAECIAVLPKRIDIVTRAARTPYPRFTADRAGEFGQTLPLQVRISAAFLTSALARTAWLCALIPAWQMAVVSGAVGASWL